MKVIFGILLSIFLSFFFIKFSYAAPAMHTLIINHETKQCSEFFPGDEYSWSYPPEGWKEYQYNGVGIETELGMCEGDYGSDLFANCCKQIGYTYVHDPYNADDPELNFAVNDSTRQCGLYYKSTDGKVDPELSGDWKTTYIDKNSPTVGVGNGGCYFPDMEISRGVQMCCENAGYEYVGYLNGENSDANENQDDHVPNFFERIANFFKSLF